LTFRICILLNFVRNKKLKIAYSYLKLTKHVAAYQLRIYLTTVIVGGKDK
jgi:hypothetical protein